MRTLISCLGACVAVLLVTGLNTALATSLATTSHALNDGAGPSGGVWQGSQNFSGVGFFGGTLDADVEFAVFAPGNFQNFLNDDGINFVDPAPSEFIYAYQIVNIAGTSGVTNFSVGLQSNESAGITGATFIPSATDHGTYSPVPIQDPGTTGGGPGAGSQSVWGALPGYLAGEASGILFYSSPQLPELGFATTAAGTASESIADSMPNPVPEPATVVMCLAAGLALVARRRR